MCLVVAGIVDFCAGTGLKMVELELEQEEKRNDGRGGALEYYELSAEGVIEKENFSLFGYFS